MTLAWVPAWAWLLIHALAAYRLTILWTRDSLPPLPALRQYVATRWGHKAWSELMDCPWCCGFHFAWIVAVLASSPLAPAWQWLALPLAMSAIIGLLAEREG